MKTLTLLLTMTLAAASGTVQAATHDHDMSQHRMAAQPSADSSRHEGVGVLKAINEKTGKVQIAHEAIGALGWPPMTMWFELKAPLPNGAKAGDPVRFQLEEIRTGTWAITHIEGKH